MQWGDVGGLEEVKQRLKEAVQWPHLQPEALARLGAEPPKGMLRLSYVQQDHNSRNCFIVYV